MYFQYFFTNKKDKKDYKVTKQKVLQSNQNKKIRLAKKLQRVLKQPNLIVNIINIENKCKLESFDKKSLDKLGLERQTKLPLNNCFWV